jgi:purine-binding chemotaxis protein CheW
MSRVGEIILMPETIEVPLTPNTLVGLANIRGATLPILDLRSLLGIEPLEEDTETSTVVVITWRDAPVGLRVDEIHRVLPIGEDEMQSTALPERELNPRMIRGITRDGRTGDLIHLLQLAHVMPENLFVPPGSRRRSINGGGGGGGLLGQAPIDEYQNNSVQLVSFYVAEQEFGLKVQAVQEIVRVPEGVNRMPQAMDHVLGLVTLRDNLLPLISLRRLFHLGADQPVEDCNRVVVVSLPEPDGRQSLLGVVVDQVTEVISVPERSYDSLSELIADRADMREIGSICRLDDGKRLVSVIKARELFAHPAVAAAMPPQDKATKRGAPVQKKSEEVEDEIDLVVFRLGKQEFGVVVDHVQEILRVSQDMTQMPNTPNFIEGLVNLRGTVLPVLNMRTRFNMERLSSHDRQRVLVLVIEGVRMGFVVDSVTEVRRVPVSCVELAPAVSETQRQVMGKVINLRDENRMIILVNAQKIVSSEELESMVA